jgi:hypothetical protein
MESKPGDDAIASTSSASIVTIAVNAGRFFYGVTMKARHGRMMTSVPHMKRVARRQGV